MSDNSVLTLQRKSSRYLAVLLLIAHLASLGLVWLISVPLWIKVVLNGLLIISAGTGGNVIRVLSPLTITDAQLNKGLQILRKQLLQLTNLKL